MAFLWAFDTDQDANIEKKKFSTITYDFILSGLKGSLFNNDGKLLQIMLKYCRHTMTLILRKTNLLRGAKSIQNQFTFTLMTITRDYKRGWVAFKNSTNIGICMFVEYTKLLVLKLCVYFHLCSPRHVDILVQAIQ